MAYKATIISPLCSLTLVPAIEVGDDIMGDDIFLGHDTLSNRLPYSLNNMQKRHKQKVALSDAIVLQLHTTAASIDVTAHITDCEGNNIFALDISYVADEIYNTYDPQGNAVYLNTIQYNFRFSDYFDDADEGLYRVKVQIDYDGITTATFRSEVIDMKVEHDDTQYLEYSCEVNRLETLFEQHPTGFGRRFSFKIGAIDTEREESDFISQAQKMVKVTSYPYNLYEFHFEDIADYEVSALNHIFSCDKFKVNTQVFVTDQKLELEARSGTMSLYQGSIIVRDAELNQNFTYPATDTIIIFNMGGYPFNVFVAVIEDGFNKIYLLPRPRVFSNDADIDNFVAELNTVFVPQQGLKGVFIRVGISLRYINGQGENYRSSNDDVVAVKRIEMTVETFSAVQQYQFTQREFYACVDWGDGSPLVAINYALFSSGYQLLTHAYLTAGTYTVVFWWATNNVASVPLEGTGLRLSPPTNPNGGANYSVLKNVVGIGNPTRLREFWVTYADFTGNTIDTSWLKDSYMHLDTFQIVNCNMDSFEYTSFNLTGGLKWNLLRAANFNNNKLPQANVNSILVAISNNTTYPTPIRLVNTKGQTPAAPPSGNGILAKSKMVNAGWNIQTD